MKNNKVKIFLLIIVTLVIIIATIFLFNKISFGANLSVDLNEHTYWDGTTVSTSLSGSGTSSDPYLIQNGADLEYFLSSESIRNKYFRITNDIYLNKGYFDYDKDIDMIIYYLNGNKYYINNDKYYSDPLFQHEVGSLNVSSCKDDFTRGDQLDGLNQSIVGLYTNNSGFIEEMDGSTIKNINFLNCTIIGTNISGTGLVNITRNYTGTNYVSQIENIMFNGIIKDNSAPYSTLVNASTSAVNKITLSNNTIENKYSYSHNIITGTASNSFIYEGISYPEGNFTLRCTPGAINTTITVTPKYSGQNVTFSNLTNTLYYYKSTTGLISLDDSQDSNNLKASGITVHGYIVGKNIVGGILGTADHANRGDSGTNINNSSNYATICGGKIMGGIVGYYHNSGTISRVYNVGKIESGGENVGGFVGLADMVYQDLIIERSINDSSDNYIGFKTSSHDITNNYYSVTTKNTDPIIDNWSFFYLSQNTILNSFVPLFFISYSNGGKWIINTGEYPHLFFEDYTPPSITITYESDTWNETSHERTLDKIYVNDETYNHISVNVTDTNDIAKIEYYNDETIRTASLNINSISNNNFNLLTNNLLQFLLIQTIQYI